MRPEFFLENDLECISILSIHSIEYSLILDQIERTGRIYHLTSDLQCMEGGIEELGLESGNFFDIFQMPVSYCVSPFEQGSLTTTRSIEEYSVEYLIMMTIELSWIEGDPDITTSHAFQIL